MDNLSKAVVMSKHFKLHLGLHKIRVKVRVSLFMRPASIFFICYFLISGIF